MQKTGLQNEIYVDELVVSGSTKITTKNETGVYVFQESNTKDGVVFGKMQKPKYNKNEVEQSIDVIITELLPVIPPEVPETVLKSVYDALMEERNDLTKEVEKLNKDILNLQAIINSLEIVNESLQVERFKQIHRYKVQLVNYKTLYKKQLRKQYKEYLPLLEMNR